MNWLLLLLLTLVCQMILILWRPRGYWQLILALLSVQWITACLVSALVGPMIFGAMLTTWDEWQDSKNDVKADVGEKLQPRTVLPYREGEGGVLSTPYLHGPVADWQGIDYARPCGLELVAPADMIVEGVSSNDGAGNTSLRVRLVDDSSIELGYVHGVYNVAPGDYIRQGDVFGRTDTIGTSTGCHDHLVYWDDGVLGAISDYSWNGFTTVDANGQKPLIMSSYDPHAGGRNCDNDCTTTASGELVENWWGAGAACVPEWMGKTLEIDGKKWKCIDKGGKIVETTEGYWVDLLTKHSSYIYGQQVSNWRFVD